MSLFSVGLKVESRSFGLYRMGGFFPFRLTCVALFSSRCSCGRVISNPRCFRVLCAVALLFLTGTTGTCIRACNAADASPRGFPHRGSYSLSVDATGHCYHELSQGHDPGPCRVLTSYQTPGDKAPNIAVRVFSGQPFTTSHI